MTSTDEPTATRSVTWPVALVLTVAALWSPFAIAALASAQVRRGIADVWLWPGLVPGFEIAGQYDEATLAGVTVALVVVLTCAIRYRPVLGAVAALLVGLASTGKLMALLAV